MEIEKVLELAKIGFTKEEIISMMGIARASEDVTTAKEEENRERVAAEPQITAPAASPEITKLKDEITSLQSSIKELTKTNQKMAIQNSTIEAPKELDIFDVMTQLAR